MRVRGLHTYPTLSAAVTEFEQMAAGSGLLPLGDAEGKEAVPNPSPDPSHQKLPISSLNLNSHLFRSVVPGE